MSMRIIAILSATLMLAACDETGTATKSVAASISFGPCAKPALIMATSLVSESECGVLSVWENRSKKTGRKIDLKIMRVPALKPKPKPDPIFFLAGGPGQAATEIGPIFIRSVAKIRKDRDIILVDQRGTGSSNPLNCMQELPEYYDVELTLRNIADLQKGEMKSCLEEYEADTRYYVTPIAMDDLNEVREAMGYEKINLIGSSYGTRAALVYIRRHGETVRSAVLDGVVPLTMIIPQNMARDAQRSLDLLLSDCELDRHCKASFPLLREHLFALVDRLNEQPENINFVHPRTGQRSETLLSAPAIANTIRAALYSGELTSLLPLAIEKAYAGDYQPLLAIAGSFDNSSLGMSVGMFASVICGEDWAHLGSRRPQETDNLFDDSLLDGIENICEFWPRPQLPEGYFTPVTSDVPVLLTSGQLDPVTPPVWGQEAAATLTNSLHIVVPGVGHNTLHYGCVKDLLNQFIDEASIDNIEDSCAYGLKRPTFFYSPAGPAMKPLADPSDD